MKHWWHWGVGVGAAYVVFVGATTGFVLFAMHRPVELVTPDYYAQSLREDEHREAVANAMALGPGVSVSIAGAVLTIALPADQAKTAVGDITLYRPSKAADDRTYPLALDLTGHQRVDLSAAPAGEWMVKLRWSAAGRAYSYQEPVRLP